MSRRLVAAAALLALAAAGAPAATAAPRPAALVLSGTGASFTEISLPRSVGVLPMRLAENDRAQGWSSSGCGAVRGFYLRPMSGDPMKGVGAVDFAELRYGAATDVSLPGGPIPRAPIPLGVRYLNVGNGQTVPDTTPVVLPAGRYRAYVLGEGACRVTIPLSGLRSPLRATATRPARMQAKVTPLDAGTMAGAPATPAPRAGASLVPITVGPSTFALSLIHVVSYETGVGPSSVNVASTCVEADVSPSCSLTAHTLGTVPKYGQYHQFSYGRPAQITVADVDHVFVPVTITAGNVGRWHAPGWLAPGAYYVKVNAVTLPSTAMQAVAFALDL